MHKTANILDKVPKSVQGKAKQLIHKMYLAPTSKAALAAYDQFISSYQIKFPKACECLAKDKEALLPLRLPSPALAASTVSSSIYSPLPSAQTAEELPRQNLPGAR